MTSSSEARVTTAVKSKLSSDDMAYPGFCLTGWPWATPPVIEASSVISEKTFGARFLETNQNPTRSHMEHDNVLGPGEDVKTVLHLSSCCTYALMQTMLHPPLLPMLSGFLEIVCSIVRSQQWQRLGRTAFIRFQRIKYNQALPL